MKTLKIVQVAALFDTHPGTVRRWVQEGRFDPPPQRRQHERGRPYRFAPEAVLGFQPPQRGRPRKEQE